MNDEGFFSHHHHYSGSNSGSYYFFFFHRFLNDFYRDKQFSYDAIGYSSFLTFKRICIQIFISFLIYKIINISDSIL